MHDRNPYKWSFCLTFRIFLTLCNKDFCFTMSSNFVFHNNTDELLYFNMNSSFNESKLANNTGYEEREILKNRFLVICLISAIYLCVLSVLTTVSNGVLLVVLYQDPFKSFRHPPSIFIIGLAVADFFTGIAVDPLFAYFYFELYKDKISSERYNFTLKAAGFLSSIIMNVSFLTILFLSWTQFIAITFPYRHKQLVTTGRVVACICGIWTYSLLFSCTLLMGVPEKIFQKLDVFFNLSLINVLVLVSYIALHVSYRRQIARLIPTQNNAIRIADTSEQRRRKDQKHFVVVSSLLATCLLVFIAPVTVMWYLTLYWTPKTDEERVKATMANVIVDATLFMKFLIDPFIYAWRLPKFREAVKAIFTRRRRSFSVGALNVHNLNIHASTSRVNWSQKGMLTSREDRGWI